LVFSLSRLVCFSEDPIYLGHSDAYFSGDFVCRDSLIAKFDNALLSNFYLIALQGQAPLGRRLAAPDAMLDLFFDGVCQAFLSFNTSSANFAKVWEAICLLLFCFREEIIGIPDFGACWTFEELHDW
jgi:hypothetical protein